MDQWEYDTLVVTWNAEQERWEGTGTDKRLAGKTMPELLNQIGWDGWELVSVIPDNYSRVNWIDYTVWQGSSLMPTGSSSTAWGISRYRAFFKRKRS